MNTFRYKNANKVPRYFNWKHPGIRRHKAFDRSATTKERQGFIIDLNHANRAKYSPGRRTRTGTLIFMAPKTMLGIGMASLKRDLISFFFVLLWAATITLGRQLDSKSKLAIELWNEGLLDHSPTEEMGPQ